MSIKPWKMCNTQHSGSHCVLKLSVCSLQSRRGTGSRCGTSRAGDLDVLGSRCGTSSAGDLDVLGLSMSLEGLHSLALLGRARAELLAPAREGTLVLN